MNFPDDENGDVLKRMYESGMDLSKSYDIDFYHIFENRKDAESMLEVINNINHGFDVYVALEPNNEKWDICCTVNLIPTHNNITEKEEYFESFAEKHQGQCDGWGILH